MTKVTYSGPFTPKAAFANKSSHPLLLDLILIKKIGPEYLEWEPETLWAEISKSFNTTIAEVNKAKIQAARTCHVTESPYETWNIFEKVTVAFSGGIPRFDLLQKRRPHMCSASLDVMKLLKDAKVSDEVYRYIAAVMLDDGMCYGVGPLLPCNKYLRKFIPQSLQNRVKALVEKGRSPSFDGTTNEDIQVFKTRSVEDYSAYDSQRLLSQINSVFKGGA